MNLTSLLRPTNGNHTKPKEDEVFTVVYTTYDYGKFKKMDANRILSKPNLTGLLTSFSEAYLLTIVIVNELFEIIDGQHRFEAAKESSLPIRYIVMPGYGIDEVRQYNKTMQKWLKVNYKDSYVTEGRSAYVELDEFMKQFPELGIKNSLALLTGVSRGESQKLVNGLKVSSQDFNSGKLSLNNVTKAYITARKIMDFKEYYSGFSSPAFVSSLLSIMSKKSYDHKRMLHKLKSSSIHLHKCGTQEQYRMLLQKIYNYKTSADDRADFINI